MLEASVMIPVVGSIVKPAVEENVPAVLPAGTTGVGLVPETQYAALAYEKAATGAPVIVTEKVAVVAAQPPEAATVLVTT